MSLNTSLGALMSSVRYLTGYPQNLGIDDATRELTKYNSGFNQYLSFPKVISNDKKLSSDNGDSQTITIDTTNTNSGFFELIPTDVKYVNISKGDTVIQSLVVKTTADISHFQISFFTPANGHFFPDNTRVVKIDTDTYKVVASCTFYVNTVLRALDLYEDKMKHGKFDLTLSQPVVMVIHDGGGEN